MQAVDTNVLVRLVIVDDEHQHALATRFFATRTTREPAFVPVLVLVEALWVLHSAYGIATDDILEVYERLLDADAVRMESAKLIRDAIGAARGGADFADAVIGLVAVGAGASTVVTFDRKASKQLGFTLLTGSTDE